MYTVIESLTKDLYIFWLLARSVNLVTSATQNYYGHWAKSTLYYSWSLLPLLISSPWSMWSSYLRTSCSLKSSHLLCFLTAVHLLAKKLIFYPNSQPPLVVVKPQPAYCLVFRIGFESDFCTHQIISLYFSFSFFKYSIHTPLSFEDRLWSHALSRPISLNNAPKFCYF